MTNLLDQMKTRVSTGAAAESLRETETEKHEVHAKKQQRALSVNEALVKKFKETKVERTYPASTVLMESQKDAIDMLRKLSGKSQSQVISELISHALFRETEGVEK